MAEPRISAISAELPWTLQQKLTAYVSWVEDVADEIFERADVPRSATLLDDFLFFAGIRKLWSLVNAQYWTADNSLSILQDYRVEGVSLAGSTYTRNSSEYRDLQVLRTTLRDVLADLQILHLVESSSLSELLERLQQENE